MRKHSSFEPYEAPRTAFLSLDTTCTLMQESVEAPSGEGGIPDVVIEPLDWIL